MTKLRKRRRDAALELAKDIWLYMDVMLPAFVHPHQLSRRFGVTIGAAHHALHLLNLQGLVVRPFQALVRGGWMRHAYERRTK